MQCPKSLGFVSGCLVSAIVLWSGRSGAGNDTLAAAEFQLRDSSERVIARLHSQAGDPILELLDRQGGVGASLELNYGYGRATVRGPQGAIVLHAGPTPGLDLIDTQGVARLTASIWDNGTELEIHSAGDRRKLCISQGDGEGLRIEIGGSIDGAAGSGDLNPLAVLRASEQGDFSIALESDSTFKQRPRLPGDWSLSLKADGTLSVNKRTK